MSFALINQTLIYLPAKLHSKPSNIPLALTIDKLSLKAGG